MGGDIGLQLIRQALGARVAEIVQHIPYEGRGSSIGKPDQWIPTRNLQGTLAGVGVGAILHPTVLLAFPDRARFLQDREGPPPSRLRLQRVELYRRLHRSGYLAEVAMMREVNYLAAAEFKQREQAQP